jgi:ketosteroid isomerase-like protein
MAQGDVTDEQLAELIERTAESAAAFISGDMTTYAELVPHSDDFTLMPPYGGDIRRGFDGSPEALAEMAKFFQQGEATLEVHASYTSGDLVVLAVTERQHGVIGGIGDQDWSLRATLVWRRTGSGWELVHRHADAMVHPISHEQVSVLAAGRQSATG